MRAVSFYFMTSTFIYYPDWLNQAMKTEKKIVLILDNASSHKRHKILDFIKKHKEKIELVFLPPYSPESRSEKGTNPES